MRPRGPDAAQPRDRRGDINRKGPLNHSRARTPMDHECVAHGAVPFCRSSRRKSLRTNAHSDRVMPLFHWMCKKNEAQHYRPPSIRPRPRTRYVLPSKLNVAYKKEPGRGGLPEVAVIWAFILYVEK